MHLGFPTMLRASSEEFGAAFVDHTSEYRLHSSNVPFWVFLFSRTDGRIYLSADADDDARESFNVLIPISVLRDHSKMREVSHRTETLRVGFQLIESFTHLINHGIKRGKSEIRELFFA